MLTLRGSLCVDVVTIRESMLQKFIPSHTLANYHAFYQTGQANSHLSNTIPLFLLVLVTNMELWQAISKRQKHSALGFDNIPMILYKHCFEVNKSALLYVFNFSLLLGEVPLE